MKLLERDKLIGKTVSLEFFSNDVCTGYRTFKIESIKGPMSYMGMPDYYQINDWYKPFESKQLEELIETGHSCNNGRCLTLLEDYGSDKKQER